MVDKPDIRALQIDRDGFVHQAFRDWDPSADVSTDLLLNLALRRRALACDIAGLCSYDAMHVWHETMLAEYLRTPPPTYNKVSLQQLKSADEEVWRICSDNCRQGVGKRLGDERSAFELAFNEATRDLCVRMRMMPTQWGSNSGASSSGGAVARTTPPTLPLRSFGAN